MTRAQVFRWAVPFMWRAITRTLDLFRSTMVVLSWLTLVHHLGAPRDTLLLPRTINFLVDVIRLIVSTAAFVVVWLFLVLLGVVLTPILPLLSPLLLIPWFKDVAQGVLDGLVESIGDVASWKERPVRASAMRLVVRDALARAKELVGDGDVAPLRALAGRRRRDLRPVRGARAERVQRAPPHDRRRGRRAPRP